MSDDSIPITGEDSTSNSNPTSPTSTTTTTTTTTASSTSHLPQSSSISSLQNGSLATSEVEEEEEVEDNGLEDVNERIKRLEEELVTTRSEKETFEAQYRSLLGKLTTMRNTLGDKLKQDADELDRREQAITDLRASNEDLLSSLETLRLELIQSNSDSDHAHTELEQLRLRAFDSLQLTSEEATNREMSLREAQEDLERVRMEKEEWESETMRERVRREELVARVSSLEVELGATKGERELLREERDKEAESAANLLAVLEEFQSAKDSELKSTLGDLELRLGASAESLAEFKRRANLAEARLLEAQNDSEKVYTLTKEAKEKNLLVGKLRHEAVIANEHLTEALRRLKKDSNENSVDRRLVSNVLITFLNTPRADTKRFEMLQLISSILSWTDEQREAVGLQKSLSTSAALLNSPGIVGGTRPSRGHSRSGKGKSTADALGDNETFSTLWIEFLLKEASGPNASNASSSPTSPSLSNLPLLDPLSPTSGGMRRFSVPDVIPLAEAVNTRRPSLINGTLLFGNSSGSGAGSGEGIGAGAGIPKIIREGVEEL